MPIGGERAAVQNPFLRYAEGTGWTVLSRGITSPVLDTVLIDQLQRPNPGVVDYQCAQQIRDRLVRVRPNIEGNLPDWEYLKGLQTVFVDAENRERNIRLLDPVNVEANAFHIADEFTFSNGSPPDIRTDVMLFVNGVPVIIGETKSARQVEGIAQAFDDIRYYHEKGPELGFTGTPIHKAAYGKGTFKVFGADDEKGYLDKYSIRESVADGTTAPFRYRRRCHVPCHAILFEAATQGCPYR